MKMFIRSLRDVVIAGFFFLLPVYVLFFVLAKAWKPLSSVGTKIAALFGLNSVLGVAGSTVFSVLLLIVTWLICGLLVRFSFVAALNRAAEGWLSKNIPGYRTYKTLAEDKFQHGAKTVPLSAALLKQQECWQPAYIIEHDAKGNYVVFIPDIPDTAKGRVVLAREDQLRVMPLLTAS